MGSQVKCLTFASAGFVDELDRLALKDLYSKENCWSWVAQRKFRWLEALKEADALRAARHLFFQSLCRRDVPYVRQEDPRCVPWFGFFEPSLSWRALSWGRKGGEGSHTAGTPAPLWSTQPSEAFELLNLVFMPLGNQSWLTTVAHCLQAGVSKVTCPIRGIINSHASYSLIARD